MKATRLVFRLALLSVVGLGVSPIAVVNAEEQQYVIEEVIVTARKREESAQDVPIPITALTEGIDQIHR